jgi:hypothetical protein
VLPHFSPFADVIANVPAIHEKVWSDGDGARLGKRHIVDGKGAVSCTGGNKWLWQARERRERRKWRLNTASA